MWELKAKQVYVDMKYRHFGSGSLRKLRKSLCAFMCVCVFKGIISEFTIDDAMGIKDLLLGRVVYSLYFSCQDFSSMSFTITSHPFFVFDLFLFVF